MRPAQLDAPAEGRRQRSDVHTLLRQETLPAHRALESELDLLDPQLSIARYQRVLRAFHGFYEPLERRLVELVAAAPPLGFALIDRSALLARDLHALGMARGESLALPRCARMPVLHGNEGLAGALYVLEGASLGARVIAPRLEQHLQLKADSGAAFFANDGQVTASRWRRTLAWLDEATQSGEASAEGVVAAASEVFGKLLDWVRLQGIWR